MHSPTFLVSTLVALASALPAPGPANIPDSPSKSTIRLGRRNLLLPDVCEYTDPKTNIHYPDILPDVKRGLVEAQEVMAGALALDPTAHNNWFENFFPASEYQTFHDVLVATSAFAESAETFDTIHLDCATAAQVPRACLQREWDGGNRLAFTDVENDIIYFCPAMFTGDSEGNSVRRLYASEGGQDEDGDGVLDVAFIDAFCPQQHLSEPEFALANYQGFATTLVRELAHTGSAIRKVPGTKYKHTDEVLHAKIEKFGWVATMAYWERVCNYEIPVQIPARDESVSDKRQEALKSYLSKDNVPRYTLPEN